MLRVFGHRVATCCDMLGVVGSNLTSFKLEPTTSNIFTFCSTSQHGLSPGQTIATSQHNISQHCWAQHVACVWPPCCDLLRHVGCCWLKFDQFQTWAINTQHVATHRNTVAKRTQAVAPNNVAICCVDMLRSFGRGLRPKSAIFLILLMTFATLFK